MTFLRWFQRIIFYFSSVNTRKDLCRFWSRVWSSGCTLPIGNHDAAGKPERW